MDALATIVAALAAGALAKGSDIGGKVVTDAYEALTSWISDKYADSRKAVDEVSTAPQSKEAHENAAAALADGKAGDDDQLLQRAQALAAALSAAPEESLKNIGVDLKDIRTNNATLRDIAVARGIAVRIVASTITNDLDISGLRVGYPDPK